MQDGRARSESCVVRVDNRDAHREYSPQTETCKPEISALTANEYGVDKMMDTPDEIRGQGERVAWCQHRTVNMDDFESKLISEENHAFLGVWAPETAAIVKDLANIDSVT